MGLVAVAFPHLRFLHLCAKMLETLTRQRERSRHPKEAVHWHNTGSGVACRAGRAAVAEGDVRGSLHGATHIVV